MDALYGNYASSSQDVVPKPMQIDEPVYHLRQLLNRPPTPQDLLELSARIYKNSRRLYNEADSQGLRVYHDELIMGDVRLVMLVPSWFPKAHVTFDWNRVEGDTVSIVFVLRGTCQDLVGNTKANLQLVFNKLIDDQHLPDVAADATKVIQAWLLELLLRHPNLDASSSSSSGWQQQQRQWQQYGGSSKQLRLDVHVTGHSLGGLLAEVSTVESQAFAELHGAAWHCTSFESPGLPELYHRAALRCAPNAHWDDVITSYLAAPNVINMLYEHLGRVVHVVVPWEQTWSHVVKCLGADVARVTAWAIVGGMVLAAAKQITAAAPSTAAAARNAAAAAGAVQRQQQDDDRHPAAAVGGVIMQQCNAGMPQLPLRGSSSSTVMAAAAAARSLQAAAVATTPAVFTVSETTTAAANNARMLAQLGTSIAGASMAAAADAAAAAAAANTAAAAAVPARVSGAVIGAAAAAGEAAVNIGSARMLQYVARKSGFGVLLNAVGGWWLGRGGIMGVLECLAGVLGVEVEELLAQHSLTPMRQCFDPHTGQIKDRYRRDMASWPHLGHRRQVLLTAAKQVAKWSLPSFISRDNVGLANVMSRTAMVEARCARLKGYVVIGQQPDDLAAAAAVDTEAAAAAAGQLLLNTDQQQLLLLPPPPEQQQHLAAAAAMPHLPVRHQRLHRRTLRGTGSSSSSTSSAAAALTGQAAEMITDSDFMPEGSEESNIRECYNNKNDSDAGSPAGWLMVDAAYAGAFAVDAAAAAAAAEVDDDAQLCQSELGQHVMIMDS